LKIHASKCTLFATMVRYCGRLITKNGERFDPKNMEALQTMREPQNGADLVQYVAAPLGTREAGGFQRFTSSYHEDNDVGFSRPRHEDLCLDGCL
jgi:hypothetical protein